MRLVTLSVQSVRNLSPMTLECAPGVNWLVGSNGAGKSSILESISLLATSRSFRSTEIAPVVARGTSELLVTGTAQADGEPAVRLGISRTTGGETVAKRDQTLLRRASDLARSLPAFVFDANTVAKVFGAAVGRRSLLDWGVFHVEPEFGRLSRSLKLALANRNALLKRQAIQQLPFWDSTLDDLGTKIHEMRAKYLEQWTPRARVLSDSMQLPAVEIGYLRGWDGARPLLEVLSEAAEQDIRVGRTIYGPHRADLRLRSALGLARETLSRGQQKALAAALVLAQLTLSSDLGNTTPIALIDDLLAELDAIRAEAVISSLRKAHAQVFCAVIELPEALVQPAVDRVFRLREGVLVGT